MSAQPNQHLFDWIGSLAERADRIFIQAGGDVVDFLHANIESKEINLSRSIVPARFDENLHAVEIFADGPLAKLSAGYLMAPNEVVVASLFRDGDWGEIAHAIVNRESKAVLKVGLGRSFSPPAARSA